MIKTDSKTQILLRIVRNWKIKEKPEYRGFRCANCQRYIFKAWHYYLNAQGYKTPVHFCKKCKIELKLPGRIYKKFSCDKCSKNMRKAWHIWKRKKKILSETHLCKGCGKKLKLK